MNVVSCNKVRAIFDIFYSTSSGLFHLGKYLQKFFYIYSSSSYLNEKTSLKKVAMGAGCKNVIECDGIETPQVLSEAIKCTNKSYVIISKVKPGNIEVKSIPLNPIKIKERFKKNIIKS